MDRVKVDKKDYSRVLLSETSPVDVPIIFSNNWFYKHIKEVERTGFSSDIKNKVVEFLFVNNSDENSFIPIKYSILNGKSGFRFMGLLHPASQTQIIELYRNYSERVLYHCSKSSYSMRKPSKVASSYYIRNRNEHSNEYRDGDVSQEGVEHKFKFCSTYFSYSNYTKLYQFFDSKEFLSLEQKFTHFWSLDVSKCFDSIYTHSISWAVKNNKIFAKDSRSSSDFSSFFDRLMQRSNFNETNGILIGNEVSRIFAEIILQSVDIEIKKHLLNEGLVEGKSYVVRRYVDDFFIFSSSEEELNKIVSIIEKHLRFYKLHLNQSKLIKRNRPFITNITRAKLDIIDALDWLFDILFKVNERGEIELNESRVRNPHSIKRKFMDKVMAASFMDEDSYKVMCGYVISAILNKVKRITGSINSCVSDHYNHKNVFSILLDIAFHLFNIYPTSPNSLKLSIICYITYQHFEKYNQLELDSIRLDISTQVKSFFDSSVCKQFSSKFETYVPIEFSNLLCVARNMGGDYLLHPSVVMQIFGLEKLKKRSEQYLISEDSCDYFLIMSALYYIGNESDYNRIKELLIKEINKRLNNLSDIRKDARVCYLFLDAMSCPYIDEGKRRSWSKVFEKQLSTRPLSDVESDNLYQMLSSNTWFICWEQMSLKKILEKKELLFGY